MLRVLAATILLLNATAFAAPSRRVHPTMGSIADAVAGLRPGEFVWEPQAAPQGPLLLVVSLPTQRAVLFRNGVPIAASTISSGREGRETPTGVFTILEKQVEHRSSTYDNAPMPFMQRLTWRGVALHAGNLPGYPASHGCIRLPKEFAKLLYGTTRLGMTVVVTSRAAIPRVAPTPALALAGGDHEIASTSVTWTPERSPTGPVSIVVSTRDGRAVVLRNGIEIGSAPVTMDAPVAGSWVYLLRSVDSAGQHWIRLGLGEDDPSSEVERAEWARFRAPDEFRKAVAGIVSPGTSIVVTADSLRAGATGSALTVLDDGAAPDGSLKDKKHQ